MCPENLKYEKGKNLKTTIKLSELIKTKDYTVFSVYIQHFAMDVTRMTRLAHWKLYTLAENYPEYMDRYSIMMERLKMAITWNASSI